jgi:Flp pilus assembly protein CpaB
MQPLPLVGIVLVLIALVGYWSVYRATTERTPVLVAAHNLTAGTVLQAGDLRAVELAGDGEFMAGLTSERELDAVLGSRLGVSLESGLPLPRGALGEAAPALVWVAFVGVWLLQDSSRGARRWGSEPSSDRGS